MKMNEKNTSIPVESKRKQITYVTVAAWVFSR